MKVLKANLEYGNLKNTISIPELGISVTNRVPSGAICRAIMINFPQYENYSIDVYHKDKHYFTINNVKSMSLKTIEEHNNGPIIVKYKSA